MNFLARSIEIENKSGQYNRVQFGRRRLFDLEFSVGMRFVYAILDKEGSRSL